MASSVGKTIFIDTSPLSPEAQTVRDKKWRCTDYVKPNDWQEIRLGYWNENHSISEKAREDYIRAVSSKTIAGHSVLELTPRTYDASVNKVILYIHGGAFTLGSPDCLIQIPAPLAYRTGWKVLAVDYPLAPYEPSDDPHPAHTAVFNVYKRLLQDYSAKDIAFLGDSAGGNIAFGVALMARDQGVDLPGAIVAYAPWVDLEQQTNTYFDAKRIEQTIVLTPPSLESARDAAFGKLEKYSDYVSPIHGDYQGFSDVAVAIYPAGRDLLRDENLELADRLANAAKVVDVFYKEGTWHNYQQDGHLLPEARECAERAAHFLSKHLSLFPLEDSKTQVDLREPS